MPRYKSDMRDVPTHFEQPGNAFMPKVVEVQIHNPKQLAGPREGRAYRVGSVWENAVAVLRLALYDRRCLRR